MKRYLILTLTLLMAACTSQGTRTDTTQVDQLKPGRSTVADAERLLGSPQSVTKRLDGGTTLGYSFSAVKTDPASTIPAVGPSLEKATTTSGEYTAVTFDQRGLFTNYSRFQRN
ncbi:hypothetical protein L2Y96_12785 [Luteibacter aegosomaticola]|uniref:hypothetical protein n=1 Tax=Luteibacter aegosomaticola TaxID=2911538 RepID=UPI001FFB940B|nr:hypothetical protein [Luteibacter aegosomaticola]UPG88296.1 hypothetical protein L2Y96_12785 [Luteibacter aegosomaticola]